MKKIISLATILTVAAMAMPVGALTTAELQTQITQLQAQLATLTAQLTALGGASTGVPAACAGMTSFTRNLSRSMVGNDVKCLQAMLNQLNVNVADTGAGSPGNETTFFGGATRAAVIRYQTMKSIAPAAGYVGPLTRASLNTIWTGGWVAGTPGTPGTPAVGCTSATEGSYTATLSSTPVSRTVNGGAGLEAYGIDIKAVNSDITVGSMDLQVSVTNATTAVVQNPSTFINGVKVYKDSVSAANLIATYTSPAFTLDTASVYYTSLTGLNFKVANGETNKLLVVVDTMGSSDQNRTVVFNVYGNGIRGRDCAGIDRFTALATTRTLTIQPDSGNATLAVTLAGDNPNSQNIQSNTTNGITTDTTVLKFNAKAQGGNTVLTRISILYTTGASEALPSVMYMKDGTTTVSSCTPTNTACVFENFRLPINAEVTKNLKVDANWAAMTDRSINTFRGQNIPAAVQGVVYERSNGAVMGTAAATLTAAITGNTMFLFEAGLKFSLVSATATGGTIASTQTGIASSTFNFSVQPFGGTLTQIVSATPSSETVNAMFVEAYWSSSTTVGVGASGTADSVITRVLAQNPAKNLADGESGTVEVKMSVSSTTTYGSGTLRFKVEGIQWTVGTNNFHQGEFSDADNKGANFTDTWFTPWVTLQ